MGSRSDKTKYLYNAIKSKEDLDNELKRLDKEMEGRIDRLKKFYKAEKQNYINFYEDNFVEDTFDY